MRLPLRFTFRIRYRQLLDYFTSTEHWFMPSWSHDGNVVSLVVDRGEGLKFVCLPADELLKEKDELFDSNFEQAEILHDNGSQVDESAWNPLNNRVSAGIADAAGNHVIKEFGTGAERGLERTLVSQPIAGHPSYSPTGRRMVFVAEWPPMDNPHKRFSLHMLNYENGDIETYRSHPDHCFMQPQWSPDGNRIAYVGDMGPQIGSRIMIADVHTGGEYAMRPTSGARGVFCQTNPTWGAGGRYLAFLEYAPARSETGCSVVVADVKTGRSLDLKRQEDGKGILGDLAWRPGTRTLLCRVEDGLVAIHFGKRSQRILSL